MIKVVSIKQTCSACPSQFEGILDDGRFMYVRYRWGYLSVSVGRTLDEAVIGEEIFGIQHGDGLDGFLNYKDLTDLTKGDIIWPSECKDEPGPLYLITFEKEK